MSEFQIARTATDTLMAAMEDLSEADQNQVIVIVRNSNGDVISHNNLYFGSDRIGLLRAAQVREEARLMAEFLKEESE